MGQLCYVSYGSVSSHLFVCFVALVIQGVAMELVGEGACLPDIFTKYRLGCELSYGSCPISLCAL